MLQLGSNLYLMNQDTSSASLLQMTGGGAGIDTSFGGSYWPQLDSLDHVRWGFGGNQPNTADMLAETGKSTTEFLKILLEPSYSAGAGLMPKLKKGKKKSKGQRTTL